jgi:hypothetical protein
MVDRRFYTGFVNGEGVQIKGRAARWYMARWLVEKLDEVAERGFQVADAGRDEGEREVPNQQTQSTGSPPAEGGERALLEQEGRAETIGPLRMEAGGRALLEQEDRAEIIGSLPTEGGERALLEQGIEPDLDDLFDKDWIIEFRVPLPPVIGLTWAGPVENVRREAG